MAIAAPTYNTSGQTPYMVGGNGSAPVSTSTTLNTNGAGSGAFQGSTNPSYPGLTSTTNSPPAYANIGGGPTFGIATPDQYVSTQLAKDLAQNSPYMNLARQSGLNTANARGMLNSSIAAGASQGAAIQAAMPMAQADAGMLANLQATNLKNKTAEDQSNIAAAAQTGAAAIGANASMTNNANSLAEAMQAQRENLGFQGEQAGLNRDWTSQFAGQNEDYALTNMQQNYMNQSGILGQSYNQQLGYGAFQYGTQLGLNNQNFYNQSALAAMNDPAIMGNPQALGGFQQFITGPFSQQMDQIFGQFFGSGGWGG